MPRSLCLSLRTVLLLACLISGASVLADDAATDAPAALPEDGAWVRYNVVWKSLEGSERTSKYTLAIVGSAVHDGRECRWIEWRVRMEAQDDLPARDTVMKWLVPAQDLRESERPFDRAVKHQQRADDGDIIEVDPKWRQNFGPFATFFPGPRRQARKLDEPQTVLFQRGKFEVSSGIAGRYEEPVNGPSDGTVTTAYSIWLDPEVPLGVAHAKYKTSVKRGDEDFGGIEFEYFLDDTGADAKPSF